MSNKVKTIAGRVIFKNTDDFDLFREKYANLFTSDDRVVSIGRGVGTPREKKDLSRDLLVARIPRLQFQMDFSPWADDEVLRADDFGFVFTCTDGFYHGSYRTPDESVDVNLEEWATENDLPERPDREEFDSHERWADKHENWTGYIEGLYHDDHEDVIPEIQGTLWRDSWQTTLDEYQSQSDDLEELFN